jgi:2-oxoglutarate-Fe(II)-dependent oxygenase superfamily protein
MNMKSESALNVAASLSTYLSPGVVRSDALQRIADGLAAGRLVLIRNAFHESFAERMFRCLDTFAEWKLYETYSVAARQAEPSRPFHYHHHNIYNRDLYPPDLKWCEGIFASEETRRLVGQLSGQDCSGGTSFSASWYQAGDHSLPHDDRVENAQQEMRNVAFVWHLSKDWRADWGGALYWCPTLQYVPPTFNRLALFVVTSASTHFVTHVSPYAKSKRLAINGWWSGKSADRQMLDAPESIVDSSADIELI